MDAADLKLVIRGWRMTPVRTTHTYLLIMQTVRAAYYVYSTNLYAHQMMMILLQYAYSSRVDTLTTS